MQFLKCKFLVIFKNNFELILWDFETYLFVWLCRINRKSGDQLNSKTKIHETFF